MTDVEWLARFVVTRSWDDLSGAARGGLKGRMLTYRDGPEHDQPY